jgi:hypothetical protein
VNDELLTLIQADRRLREIGAHETADFDERNFTCFLRRLAYMRQKDLAPLEQEGNCQFALEGIGTGVFLTEDAYFSLRLFRRTLFNEFLQRFDGDKPNAAVVPRPTNDGGFYETVVHIVVGGRTTDPIERCLGGPNISGFGSV